MLGLNRQTPKVQRRLERLHRCLWQGKELPVRKNGHYPLWWFNPRYRQWLILRCGPPRFEHSGLKIGSDCHFEAIEALVLHRPDVFRPGNIGLCLRERHKLVTETAIEDGVYSTAVFSRQRVYRYFLSRQWSHDVPLVVLMLNPSTADATKNDPTVERIQRRAKREGYGGFIVLNFAALRSTDPRGLLKVEDPIGPYNLSIIKQTLEGVANRWRMTPDLLVAYGNNVGKIPLLNQALTTTLSACTTRATLVCLGRTKDGSPRHPLYLKNDAPLVEYVHNGQ